MTTRVSRYQKVKPIWILLKQETVSGSGIHSRHMQVCTSLQTDNHASTPPLSFLQAGCPSCRPTNSVKALKAQLIKLYDKEPLNASYKQNVTNTFSTMMCANLKL